MDTFLLNAQRIFDVACSGSSADSSEFALLVGRDGGIHMVMESELSLPAIMSDRDAQSAYRISRSASGVRVIGSNGSRRCSFEENFRQTALPEMLRDQPLYRITSPLLISTGE